MRPLTPPSFPMSFKTVEISAGEYKQLLTAKITAEMSARNAHQQIEVLAARASEDIERSLEDLKLQKDEHKMQLCRLEQEWNENVVRLKNDHFKEVERLREEIDRLKQDDNMTLDRALSAIRSAITDRGANGTTPVRRVVKLSKRHKRV